MEVILKQTIEKLGGEGDRVNVANGYARNFLLPKGLAVKATKENIEMLNREKEIFEQRHNKELQKAEKVANKIRSLSYVLTRQSSDKKKLFGSVTSNDITKFLQEQGLEIDRKDIQLEEPLKTLGTHRVPIKVHPEVTVELKVKIQAGT